jgi:hypothetical protein
VRIRLFSLLMSILVGLSLVAAAQDTKTLLLDMPDSKDPVRIVKVLEGATELKSNGHQYPDRWAWEATFNAGDDWIKDLFIVIKNVSPKKIVYVAVGCILFETADWQAELAKHATATAPVVGSASDIVGRRPDQALYSALLGRRVKPDTNAPLELEPGQEFTVALESPDAYPTLKSTVEEKMPMSNIAACNGRIGQIFFEDGTQWQGHRYKRADLNEPGHWIEMSPAEWSHAK